MEKIVSCVKGICDSNWVFSATFGINLWKDSVGTLYIGDTNTAKVFFKFLITFYCRSLMCWEFFASSTSWVPNITSPYLEVIIETTRLRKPVKIKSPRKYVVYRLRKLPIRYRRKHKVHHHLTQKLVKKFHMVDWTMEYFVRSWKSVTSSSFFSQRTLLKWCQ